jgi:phosphoribosylformylglycinamidine synthase subunit PurS
LYLAKVYVTLKPLVNDPQGRTVQGGLKNLGFASVEDVRVGKYLEIRINEMERAQAEALVSQMCRELLANPVIEEFRFELEELAPAPS